MFATRFSKITPTVVRSALGALLPRLRGRGVPLAQVVAAGAGIPRMHVYFDDCDLQFRIAHARSRSGELFFFPDGDDVLLPGPGRDQAREVVRTFVSLLAA